MAIGKDHSHLPEDIAVRLQAGPQASYLREWVYGGIDGVVTTFAIVAASIGAELSALLIIILGFANLVGDGFSMAAGAYSAAKAEHDNYDRLRDLETSHIRKYHDGEVEEIRQIFIAKGFKGKDLDQIVEAVTKDQNFWIEVMLREEYGVSASTNVPVLAGVHTFAAFMICGMMPLLPFILFMPDASPTALIFAGLTFFAIGSFKSRWSLKTWLREGVETFVIGLIAAGLAFGIGHGLRLLVL